MKVRFSILILLMAAISAAAKTRVSVGIHVGDGYGYYPPPPAPFYVYQPACPGPGYVWVPGYWYGSSPGYSWRQGYWAPPGYRSFPRGRGYRYYDSRGARYQAPVKYRGYDDHGGRRGRGRHGYWSGRGGYRQ